MDDLLQFSLHQGAKRLTMMARDISRDRLESIFKMEPESIYLEDDITRETYFPNPNGVFQTDIMRHRGSFAVCGTTKEHATASAMTPSAGPVPGISPQCLSAPFRPRGHVSNPGNSFQNPLKRTRSVRKQIYVADIEDSGKISPYTTVHVTISEGHGVQLVGQTVQEYLNSADCYTICDVKGLAIADTSETKDLEFWKSSSRKIFAIKSSDLVKLKRQENVSKKKRVEAEESEVLESIQEVELEVKNAAARIMEKVDEQCSELNIVVNQVKGSVAQVFDVLDAVSQKITGLSDSFQIMSSLKEALSCRMCTSIPSTTIVVAACCGQLAGCGECVQTYLSGNDACFFCKTAGLSSKLVFLRGLSEVLEKLR